MPDASVTERLHQITHREMPGIAVAIAGPEGLRETAAAGYADLAARKPAPAAAEMRHITVTGKRYDLGLGWFRPASQRDADPRSWSISAAAPDSST